jgi:outer membrane lipoprotein-sorting protein
MRIKLLLIMGLLPLLFAALLLPVQGRAEEGPAAAPGHPPAAVLLDRLGKEASRFNTLKTEFRQEKHLAIFRDAVVLQGRIFLQKPNRIAWHVDRPVKYSVVISDTTVRQWDEETDRVQQVSLAGNPILQNVLRQLTVWFSGAYGTLLEEYDVLVIESSPVVLRFQPKKNNMASRMVRHIQVEFRDDGRYLKKITVLEQGGDRTDITFTNTLFDVPVESGDFGVKRRV